MVKEQTAEDSRVGGRDQHCVTVPSLWLDPLLGPSQFILRGFDEDMALAKFYKSGSRA